MSTALLLTHLQKTDPTIPYATIFAALSHHLVVDVPTPTRLTAAAVSSPFFLGQHRTYEKSQGLVSAFQHAVYLKHQALVKSAGDGWSVTRMLFAKGIKQAINNWTAEILEGLRGTRAGLRLACNTGVFLGIMNLERVGIDTSGVEDEIVIALAEVMDAHNHNRSVGDWEREFQPHIEDVPISLALILASQSIPLLPAAKLKALPLSPLNHILTSTISAAFHEGNFLSSTDESPVSGLFHIPPASPFTRTIESISSSPVMTSMAGLSKLTSLVLGALIDPPNASLNEARNTLEAFRKIAESIERDWKRTKLSTIQNEDEIATDTKNLCTSIWLLLKTLLFSTIMVADGILGTVVFVPPQKYTQSSTITPRDLAKMALRTLSHISFVVSQFGGVIATAAADDPGFKELRRVFYLALDVLSSEEPWNQTQINRESFCEQFVQEMVEELRNTSVTLDQIKRRPEVFQQEKTAYTLACIEQLVPILGTNCLRNHVWELCIPHLTDSSHRETFESAHSVVLAMFASHAQRHQHAGHPLTHGLPTTPNNQSTVFGNPPARGSESRDSDEPNDQNPETSVNVISRVGSFDSLGFMQQMVPFYVQCLIENSQAGKLSTGQLRLAYAALVRGAGAGALTPGPDGSLNLAWYCIESLLDMIREFAPTEREGNVKDNKDDEQLHRLHLTLISTTSSLPLPLMIRALEEIRNIITTYSRLDSGVGGVEGDVGRGIKRKELVDVLFAEILEGVGDREKQAAMRWWYANRPKLIWGNTGHDDKPTGGGDPKKVDTSGKEGQSGKEVILVYERVDEKDL